MVTNIRLTTLSDLPSVMKMYDVARKFMREHGNSGQWVNGYPTEDYIIEEIMAGHSFVCENENDELVGTFCYIFGEDPTYQEIYDGAWLNDKPYGAVHRIASFGKEKSIGEACFKWCFTQSPNIKVDTHRNNLIMQNLLQKLGFHYCGIIYLSDGSERLAYQKQIE